MERKVFHAPLQLKTGGQEGEFEAVFATFNVVDHHGDITVPGAFTDGQPVIIESWNHGWNLPVGKGAIHSDEGKAWVEGQFLLDTQAGREHYLAIKALGGLVEWSYTFDIEESSVETRDGQEVRLLKKMDVWGVGPVTRGAGIDTHTVAIKSEGQQPAASVEKMLQQIHDLCAQLGAKCAECSDSAGEGEDTAEDEAPDRGKSSGPGLSTLAARVAMELLESE
jgi:HK97 family phage prohead protease